MKCDAISCEMILFIGICRRDIVVIGEGNSDGNVFHYYCVHRDSPCKQYINL